MALDEKTLTRMKETVELLEAKIPTLEEDLNDAQAAGIDVTESRDQLNAVRERILRIRAVYGDKW